MKKPEIPALLKAHRQFVVWKLSPKANQPKPTKMPFNPNTGGAASVTDPNTWADYDTACQAFLGGGYNGIGFVFTRNDPFAFIDIDDCYDSVSGTWLPHAENMVKILPNAAWEVSQSGKGLHGITLVSNKDLFINKRNKWNDSQGNKYEFYVKDRFIAFGQCNWPKLEVHSYDDVILLCCVPDKSSSDSIKIDWVDAAEPDYCGPTDDDELIQRAIESKGGPSVMFTKSASFVYLWNGDEAELGKFYPDDSGKRPFDNSSAEIALANYLAWWTGRNPARIERLMSRSPLCQRDKWRERADYRERTITRAINGCKTYMRASDRKQQQIERDQKIGDDLNFPITTDVITLEDALENFVFISNGSHVVDRRNKRVRKDTEILKEYSASVLSIVTDKFDKHGKPVIKFTPVFNAWLKHDLRHTVDVLTWAPGQGEFCHALEHTQAGKRAYNLWAGIQCLPIPQNWQDWVQPFLGHVAYLIPIESEREHFLQWLAHIFQYPGELPHACYLMIATKTGIGRGTLASMITRALRGYVAVNIDVNTLFGAFNGRGSQKLLSTVDEVREGNSINRYEKWEAFKSRLTEETRAINPKYGAQSLEKNCCRWLLFSNHLDALPFDTGDRRVIVIENPTERRTQEEYKYLHNIMDKPEFVASVQHYLQTLDLTGFGAHEPAPLNAIKQRALQNLESEADSSARQFKEAWPDDFAAISDLRNFIEDGATLTSRAIAHVYERVGMRRAHKQRINSLNETVLIVRGPLKPEDLKTVSKEIIAQRIITARIKFNSS